MYIYMHTYIHIYIYTFHDGSKASIPVLWGVFYYIAQNNVVFEISSIVLCSIGVAQIVQDIFTIES